MEKVVLHISDVFQVQIIFIFNHYVYLQWSDMTPVKISGHQCHQCQRDVNI